MKRPAVILCLAASVPVVAVLAAYQLNIRAGDALEPRFVCNPFFDGCVSISRAARSGPGLHVFRALMLPGAALLFTGWFLVREWLLAMKAAGRVSAGVIFGLGAVAAVFLVVYVVALGTEGEFYRWLRRYGVTVYFAGTALAQLLLLRLLWPVRNGLAGGRLRGTIVSLAALVAVQWLLGILSLVKALLLDNPELVDRIENVIEWWFALPMTLAFLPLAVMLGRTGAPILRREDSGR